MNTRLGQTKRPDLSAGQQTANDLIKLIRKLRWMHMEDEAEQVEMQLASCRAVLRLRTTCFPSRRIRTNASAEANGQ